MSEASALLNSLSDADYESYSVTTPVNDILVIDAEGRITNIPSTEVLLGAETDMDVERKYFKCPRIVGDNIDLSKLQLRVNFQNANGDRDRYIVQDVKVNGQYIEFSWVLSHKVLAAKGEVLFTVQAVAAAADGVLKNRWNTTLAKGTVLESLVIDDLDYIEEEEARDILMQLLQMMDDKSAASVQRIQTEGNTQVDRVKATGTAQVQAVTNKGIEVKAAGEAQVQAVIDKGIEVRATIPEDYSTTYAMADEGIRTKADAITNSVKGEGTLIVKDASHDPLRGLKMYGKSKQTTTNGYQLFDASKLKTTSKGGATVTNNGDGSFTISGSGTITEGIGVMHYYRSEDTLKMLKPGNITLKSSMLYPYAFAQLVAGNDTLFAINNLYKDEETVTITQEMLDTPNCQLLIGLYGIAGNAIKPGTIKPMLYQDGDGTWEPYTGGKPSPNPEYPREIDNLGGYGNLLDSKPFGTTAYKINGVTISPIFNSYGEVDYFTLNGATEVQSGSSRGINLHVPVEKNTDYILSGSHNNTGVYLYAVFGGVYYPSGIKGCKFNSGDNTEIAIELGSYGNSSFNNEKVYPMLVKADSGITTYRPYSGQQEIEHVITGRNLFDKNNCKYTNVAVSGGNIFTASERTRMYYMEVSPNTSYIYTKTLGSFLRVATCQSEPAAGVGITNTNSDTAAKTCTITTGPNDKYLAFFPLLDSEVDPIGYEQVFDSITITKRQSLITKTPYGLPGMPLGQTIPTEIQNSPAHMSGVYWDEKEQQYYIADTIDHETGKYEQRIDIQVVSDYYVWRKENNSPTNTYYPGTNSTYSTLSFQLPCYCNRFVYSTYPYQKETNGIFGYESAGNVIYFNSEIDNLEDWVAWMSENPIIIQYILRTPLERDLSAGEMEAFRALRMNKPTTMISNDSGALTEVVYNVDMDCHLDKLHKEERYISEKAYAGGIVKQANGTEIIVNDSSDAVLRGLKLYGKSTQQTYSGKNLLKLIDGTYNVNGVTATIKDGTISLSGTATRSGGRTVRLSEPVNLSAGKYIYSWSAPITCVLCLTSTEDSNVSRNASVGYATIDLAETINLYFGINVDSGRTYNETFALQLEAGTVSTDYEPYTGGIPSPNPEYPQEIESLGKENGQIETSVYGGNLIPLDKGVTKEINGVSIKTTKDGILLNGTATAYIWTNLLSEWFRLPSRQYTLQVYGHPGICSFFIYQSSMRIQSVSEDPVTSDLESDDYAFNVEIGVGRTFNNVLVKPVLVPGVKSSPFGLYKEPQSLIAKTPNGLPAIEVTDASLATYTDEEGKMWCADEIDFGRGKYVQRVGFIKLQSQSGIIDKWGAGFCVHITDISTVTHTIVCDKLLQANGGATEIYNKGSQCIANNPGYTQIVFNINGISTVNDLKTWLESNPLNVNYLLATPIERDLTQEEIEAYKQIHTNHPNTIIVNDQNALMEVKYIADTKDYTDNTVVKQSKEDRFLSDKEYAGGIIQSVDGSIIAVSDSSSKPFLGMKLFGKSEQVSTTGKNLLNIIAYSSTSTNGVTITNNHDGTYTVNGTATADIHFNIYTGLKSVLVEGKRYRIIGCPSGGALSKYILYDSMYNIFIDEGSGHTFTYSAGSSGNYVCIYIKSGTTVNNLVFKPMLVDADLYPNVTYEDFEPYTGGKPSPSPDYPQEINSLGQENGQIKSAVNGFNLFDASKLNNYSVGGATVTNNGDGSFTVSGSGTLSATYNNLYSFTHEETVKLLRAGTLNMSKIDTYPYCYAELLSDSGSLVGVNSRNSSTGTITQAMLSDTTSRLKIGIYGYSGEKAITPGTMRPMLYQDGNGTWEPYKQPQSLITPVQNGLPGIEVTDASLANYTDSNGKMWVCDEIDLERGKYIQRIGKVDLGNLDWIIDDSTEGIFYSYDVTNSINSKDNFIKANIMCTHYKPDYYYSSGVGVVSRDGRIAINRDMVWIHNKEYANYTKNEVKTAVNGVMLTYLLKTPIERDLTEEELTAYKALHTNYPNTTVFNDANAHMEVSYVVDTKKYIDNKFAELAALLTKQS